ncbi:hypothetical protein [Anaerocaecibacter muris]|nr:hypothetical protein [Anaerocaecibacter muris]
MVRRNCFTANVSRRRDNLDGDGGTQTVEIYSLSACYNRLKVSAGLRLA